MGGFGTSDHLGAVTLGIGEHVSHSVLELVDPLAVGKSYLKRNAEPVASRLVDVLDVLGGLGLQTALDDWIGLVGGEGDTDLQLGGLHPALETDGQEAEQ